MQIEEELPPIMNQMDIEEESKFLGSKPDSWQKHCLHAFFKKFSNFCIEESIFFNWNFGKKPIFYSTKTQKYYENFANLLVYSKNSLRFYNIHKIYELSSKFFNENSLEQENYELQLINEFPLVGTIQKILLFEKVDQIFFVIALSDAKVCFYLYFF